MIPTAVPGQGKMRKTLWRNQSPRQSNNGGRKGEGANGLNNNWSSMEGRTRMKKLIQGKAARENRDLIFSKG